MSFASFYTSPLLYIIFIIEPVGEFKLFRGWLSLMFNDLGSIFFFSCSNKFSVRRFMAVLLGNGREMGRKINLTFHSFSNF